MQIKIAKQKTYTEERDKERDFTILVDEIDCYSFTSFYLFQELRVVKVQILLFNNINKCFIYLFLK